MYASRVRPSAGSRGKQRFFPWVLLAFLLHLELAAGIFALLYFFGPRSTQIASGPEGVEEDALDLEMMDPDAARKILAELEREEEKRQQEAVRKEEEAPRPPGQVVDLARPRNQERPQDARFAAEFDSKVERETRRFGELNRDAVAGHSAGRDPVTTPPQLATEPPPSPAGAPPPSSPTPRVLAMRTAGQTQPAGGLSELSGASPEREPGLPPALAPRIALAPPAPPLGASAGPAAALAPGTQAASTPRELLVPSPEQVARAIGSGTTDHLAGVEEGEETALNAKKWKFASFFNRVKQQVRENWRPAEEYRKRDPTFRIYGQKDRYTLLRVQLRPDGTLADITLETPSGVEFLDDEAIEAFKQAQPFPNPPAGLVQDGTISFRFGFFFEIGGGSVPRMKYFRYNDF